MKKQKTKRKLYCNYCGEPLKEFIVKRLNDYDVYTGMPVEIKILACSALPESFVELSHSGELHVVNVFDARRYHYNEKQND